MPRSTAPRRDGIRFCRDVLAREVNAATDNPLVLPDLDDIVSGGNFHGQPVALALDVLAIAASHLASISERRVEQLVNPSLSACPRSRAAHRTRLGVHDSPSDERRPRLGEQGAVPPVLGGLDPLVAGREDHVSMGMAAALKARQVIENVRTCLAIELLVAAQASRPARAVRPRRRSARRTAGSALWSPPRGGPRASTGTSRRCAGS